MLSYKIRVHEDAFISLAGLAIMVNLNRPRFLTGLVFMIIINLTLIKHNIKISGNF